MTGIRQNRKWARPGCWAALALAIALLPTLAWAATLVYAPQPWTIAGGGGETVSTGGVYLLDGVAGQPGAGTVASTGGSYSLIAGYVPFDAVAAVPVDVERSFWLPVILGKYVID